MLKKITLAAALTALLPLSAAQAEIVDTVDTGRTIEQVYKECGLGGAIFGDTSPIFAIISNVTWDLGTTAAISDSMSPETCQGGDVRAAVLIKEAFPSVEQDLASGQGAHLSALQEVTSCASVDAIRNDYSQYAQTAGYTLATQEQNAETLYKIVNQNCAL